MVETAQVISTGTAARVGCGLLVVGIERPVFGGGHVNQGFWEGPALGCQMLGYFGYYSLDSAVSPRVDAPIVDNLGFEKFWWLCEVVLVVFGEGGVVV